MRCTFIRTEVLPQIYYICDIMGITREINFIPQFVKILFLHKYTFSGSLWGQDIARYFKGIATTHYMLFLIVWYSLVESLPKLHCLLQFVSYYGFWVMDQIIFQKNCGDGANITLLFINYLKYTEYFDTTQQKLKRNKNK